MSLLFPERATLWLSRQEAVVLHRQGLWRQPVVEDGLLAAAARVLQQFRLPHPGPARVEVVLSSALVQAFLLQAQPALGSDEEEALFVRYRCEDIFGESARQWALCWDIGLRSQSVLASAMSRDLLQGLQALMEGQGVLLMSVQPWLTVFVNALAPSMPQDWHALLVDDGQILSLSRHQGQWQRLHQMYAPEPLTTSALQVLVQREQGFGATPLNLYTPLAGQLQDSAVSWVRCLPQEWLERRVQGRAVGSAA